jgi:hypothetical protein
LIKKKAEEDADPTLKEKARLKKQEQNARRDNQERRALYEFKRYKAAEAN